MNRVYFSIYSLSIVIYNVDDYRQYARILAITCNASWPLRNPCELSVIGCGSSISFGEKPATRSALSQARFSQSFLQALQSGQTLTFAPFSISQQGMSNGREWLPWSQIQEITRKYGRVSVKMVGMSQVWGPVLIPNCRVFTTIAADLRQQAAGGS